MKQLLTVEQLAEVLALSPATIYDLVAQGHISHCRVSARGKKGKGPLRFTEEHVQEYIAKCERKAGGEAPPPQKKATPRPKHPPLRHLSLD